MEKYTLVTGACVNTGVAIVEKFAAEGCNVVFTGRDPEKVKACEAAYQQKFPDVKILGYAITSLMDERTVDEEAVKRLFATMDDQEIFVDTLVLNAAGDFQKLPYRIHACIQCECDLESVPL